MEIAVNARFLGSRMTGVQRYAQELMSRLPTSTGVIRPRTPLTGLRGHLWEQTSLAFQAQGKFLWSPCNSGPLFYEPQAVTIHDCSVFDFPDGFAPSFLKWYQFLLPRLARQARVVFTDSEFSKSRICELLNTDPTKVEVIFAGVDRRFCRAPEPNIAAVREKYRLNGPYVLSLGSIEPRKNIRRLIQAYQEIEREFPEMNLAIVGDRASIYQDPGFEKPLSSIRFLGYVDDNDLPALYTGAQLFVYPSLYEGFGLPPLEAMACGAPVICSSIKVLQEIAGEFVCRFQPDSTESIANALRFALTDSEWRAQVVQYGPERAAKFNWDESAKKLQSRLEHWSGI